MSAPTRSTALLDEFLAAGQDVALTDESGEFPRLIAEPPELPIERGLAGPGMLNVASVGARLMTWFSPHSAGIPVPDSPLSAPVVSLPLVSSPVVPVAAGSPVVS